jgi:predicted MFS family arabinose efflux permease
VAAASAIDPAGSASSRAAGDEIDPAESVVRTGQDFRIGVRAVFGHPLVRPIILTLMMWSVTGGFFVALYTPFCLRALGLPESTFGVIIAMGGVGSLGGAMLARGMARSLGVGRTLIASAALSLAFTLFIPIAGLGAPRPLTIAFLVIHQLLGDGFSVAFIILAVTLRQTALPRDVLGRANAAIHVSTTGMLVISAVIAGGLASLVGIRTAMWIGTLTGLIAPALLWPLRHLRDMPSGDLGASHSGMSPAAPPNSRTDPA